jgi:hypothetical protein
VDISGIVREKRLHVFAGDMAFDEALHYMQDHYLYLLKPREVHYLLGTLPCNHLDTGFYIQQAQSLAQKMHNLVPPFEKDMDIFSIQMKKPLSKPPRSVWACANPQAYIHYPIAKAFLRGFSQQGLQTTLADFERPLSSQCKVVGSLFTSRPDLIFTINAWPSALLEDIGLNPSLVQTLKHPRICWIVDNTSLYESEKSHYPISPHDWYFCSDRHFMTYIQPQTSQVSFLPAATMFDKKGAIQDRFSVPLSYVGSLPDLQTCLTALPPVCQELLRDLETHDSRQALPTYTAGLLALSPLPSQRQAIQQTACQFCATTQKGFTTSTAQLEYFLYNAITFYKRVRIVAALLPLGLHVYGPTSWRETLPPPYQDRYGGFVHHRDLPDCYTSAKISLNIHSSQCPTGLNPRDFDVPMSGGVVLGDYVEDVERGFLIPGQETITFTSPEQAVALAERYLNDEDQLSAIREQGHQRVKAEHTYAHRASTVLEILRKQGTWGASNDE